MAALRQATLLTLLSLTLSALGLLPPPGVRPPEPRKVFRLQRSSPVMSGAPLDDKEESPEPKLASMLRAPATYYLRLAYLAKQPAPGSSIPAAGAQAGARAESDCAIPITAEMAKFLGRGAFSFDAARRADAFCTHYRKAIAAPAEGEHTTGQRSPTQRGLSRPSGGVARCRLALSESAADEDAPDDDEPMDLGLLKMPLLLTPKGAGFQKFRERQRTQTEKAKAPPGPSLLSEPARGNDLGFSLRETVFDGGDDVFGDGVN